MIEISHMAATNTKGTRIKVLNHRDNTSKVFSKNYEYSLHVDQILDYISNKDLIVGVSCSEKKGTYTIVLDALNNSFLTLDELFAGSK